MPDVFECFKLKMYKVNGALLFVSSLFMLSYSFLHLLFPCQVFPPTLRVCLVNLLFVTIFLYFGKSVYRSMIQTQRKNVT